MERDFPRNIVLLWLPRDAEAFSPEHLFSSEERFLLQQLTQDLRNEGISLVPLPFFPRWLSRLPPDESDWFEWKRQFDRWNYDWSENRLYGWEEYWLEWKYLFDSRVRSREFSRLLARLSYEGAIEGVLIVTPSRVEKQLDAAGLKEISHALDPTSVIHLTLDPGGREARQEFRGVLSLNYPSDRSQIMRRLTSMRREHGSPLAESKASEALMPALEERAFDESYDTDELLHTVLEQAAPVMDELHDTGMPASAPASAGPVTNEVHLGAAVPRALSPSEQFVARFAAYTEGFRGEVRRVLAQEAPSSPPRLDLEVCRWQRGAKVTVRLAADQVDVANPVQTFTWNGTKQLLRFDARVLPEARANVLILRFDIAVEGFPLVTLRPEVAMSLPQREREAIAGFSFTEGIAPTSAFASYASPDRREVLGRIRSLQIFTGIDVFLDNLSIRPGERWKPTLDTEIRKRDVFWLFWSRNAKDSEWVEWEWRTALASKSLAGIQPHPLEPAEIAPPPKELSDLQFGAMYEWYISNLREPWLTRSLRILWHTATSAFRN